MSIIIAVLIFKYTLKLRFSVNTSTSTIQQIKYLLAIKILQTIVGLTSRILRQKYYLATQYLATKLMAAAPHRYEHLGRFWQLIVAQGHIPIIRFSSTIQALLLNVRIYSLPISCDLRTMQEDFDMLHYFQNQ